MPDQRQLDALLEKEGIRRDGSLDYPLGLYDQEGELARRFGVMSIPTVVFLKHGQEFERKIGALPAGELTAVLEENL